MGVGKTEVGEEVPIPEFEAIAKKKQTKKKNVKMMWGQRAKYMNDVKVKVIKALPCIFFTLECNLEYTNKE